MRPVRDTGNQAALICTHCQHWHDTVQPCRTAKTIIGSCCAAATGKYHPPHRGVRALPAQLSLGASVISRGSLGSTHSVDAVSRQLANQAISGLFHSNGSCRSSRDVPRVSHTVSQPDRNDNCSSMHGNASVCLSVSQPCVGAAHRQSGTPCASPAIRHLGCLGSCSPSPCPRHMAWRQSPGP